MDSVQPEVTLVIPARDAGATIEECLDAVVAIRDTEGSSLARIILVDDGSTDGTVEAARARGIEILQSG
ncbi:MAG: glycosyltransferase, partial [Phycisphaerales bacterium]|nr:glycosyltransferase [Phycisphaerales bacterium]